jgi:hypothetical protein
MLTVSHYVSDVRRLEAQLAEQTTALARLEGDLVLARAGAHATESRVRKAGDLVAATQEQALARERELRVRR